MDSLSRLKNEFTDLNRDPLSNLGITVGLPNENIYEWRLSLTGARDTIYNGGLFILKLVFPKEYPNKPPELYFLTPIYHLNVRPKKSVPPNDENLGHINLSYLNNWKPINTPKEMLTKLYTIFYFQNAESPYGLDRYDEYRYNNDLFEEKVKYFTKKYANPKEPYKIIDDNKDWDFSYEGNVSNFIIKKKKETPVVKQNIIAKNLSNEMINLIFELNSIKKIVFKCAKNEITGNVVKKVFAHLNLKDNKTFLVIFHSKKLNLDIPIMKNEIRDMSHITIIYEFEL